MQAKDGKKFGSKFRMNRYESQHTPTGPGPRAQAHEINGMPEEQEEKMEEEVHPGIHDEIQQVAAEHGPAHEIHMTHDHEGGVHHVHSVHGDGYEHHADHQSAEHAHTHAAHAAGLNPPNEEETETASEHKKERPHGGEKDEDEYEAEEL